MCLFKIHRIQTPGNFIETYLLKLGDNFLFGGSIETTLCLEQDNMLCIYYVCGRPST